MTENISYWKKLERDETADVKKALNKCIENCKGFESCKYNGNFTFNGIYAKCPKYKVENDMQEKLKEVSEIFKEASLENFECSTPSQKKALEVVERFLKKKAYDSGKGFVLCGENGVGKTHLLVSVYKTLIRSNVDCILRKPKLVGSKQEIETYYRVLKQPKVLLLDDVGMEIRNDHMVDVFYDLIDYRFENNLSTCMTSNMLLDDSAAGIITLLGSRLYSRLIQRNIMLNVEGGDKRFDKRKLY
jgi:DNA replication protein DnaC